MSILQTFYKRYPELRYMSTVGPMKTVKDGSMLMTHPAAHFVMKVREYEKQGYNRWKAYEMVGEELEGVFDKKAEQ